MTLALIVLFLGWMTASVVSRASILKVRSRIRSDIEPSPSPVSEALKDTLAVVGGVYLVLVALIAFLDLSVPDRVFIAGIRLNPVAFLALLLASLQPYWRVVSRT